MGVRRAKAAFSSGCKSHPAHGSSSDMASPPNPVAKMKRHILASKPIRDRIAILGPQPDPLRTAHIVIGAFVVILAAVKLWQDREDIEASR